MSLVLTNLIVLILQCQPIVKDSLVRELICLFVHKVNVEGEIESGIINYRTFCNDEDVIVEIEHIPCTAESGINWELTPVGCEWPLWRIVFTGVQFNPFLTNKYDGTNNDITDISRIIKRHQIDVIGDNWLISHPLAEVDIPPVFVEGDQNYVLSHIIEECFKDVQLDEFEGVQSRIPFVANIEIDITGEATFKSLIKATGNPYLDNLAILVSMEFCKYRFKPAVHRGKTVVYSMDIPITRREWLPYLVD